MGGLPGTRKMTSSVIRPSTVSTSPAVVADCHVWTRARIWSSSLSMLSSTATRRAVSELPPLHLFRRLGAVVRQRHPLHQQVRVGIADRLHAIRVQDLQHVLVAIP